MSDSQLRPADFNCEILPCEVPYNFEDTSQFQKLSFPEEACVRLNSLLQLAPTVAAADALSKTYVLRFPEGVQGVLMRLKQGGLSTVMVVPFIPDRFELQPRHDTPDFIRTQGVTQA